MWASSSELLETTNSLNGYLEISSCADGSLSHETTANSNSVPKVGMAFDSEEKAYSFYNSYAKQKGFSVRKDHMSRRVDGRIRYRHYVCSNEGKRKDTTRKSKNSRPIERTNCLARIEFKVNQENLWIVNKFVAEHNHPLATPNSTHMLRSHRKKLPMEQPETSNITASYFGNLQQEDTQDSGSNLKNEVNYLSTKRTRNLQNGDAQFLLNFLKAQQSADPSFFYAIQLDEKERFTNCFWADMQSIMDYSYFGDSIVFDTAYCLDNCMVPFAPFIGVNHHKQVTIFGAAILLAETVESFLWLFRTFLAAMSGKQPKTIFTGNCAAISEAVRVALPHTCHLFCLRYLFQQAATHFPYPDINLQMQFESCIYSSSEETFNQKWNSMMSNYNLAGNTWFKELYDLRVQWCTVYCGSTFTANMMTKVWFEIMDILFKTHFSRQLPLTRVIARYLKALIEFREKEILEDDEATHNKPALFADVPMLIRAAESYTGAACAEFQLEYKSQLSCICQLLSTEGTTYVFRVTNPNKQSHGLVEFNPSFASVTCSCKKFESTGILCMHALKVLNYNNVLCLPDKYIVKRWTKHAKEGVMEAPLRSKYSRVCQKAIAVSLKSSVSKDALNVLELAFDSIISVMENAAYSTQKLEHA